MYFNLCIRKLRNIRRSPRSKKEHVIWMSYLFICDLESGTAVHIFNHYWTIQQQLWSSLNVQIYWSIRNHSVQKAINEFFLISYKPYYRFCWKSILETSTETYWTILIYSHIDFDEALFAYGHKWIFHVITYTVSNILLNKMWEN
jgi:hypothetical protein